MKLRRTFFALTLLPLGLEVACGDDDGNKVVYVVPEGGTPDNSGASCEPVNTPEAQFNPSPTNQKLCSDDEIIDVLGNCAFDTASKPGCDDVRARLPACASCILGAETDPSSHPGYQYAADTRYLPSSSACMLAVAKDDESKKCAQAYGQMETCSLQSCLGPCIDDTQHIEQCLTTSLNTVCTKGTDVYSTEACQKHYEDNTYGFCTSNKDLQGNDLSDEQYFFGVAWIICGNTDAPADAGSDAHADSGPKDAGNDG